MRGFDFPTKMEWGKKLRRNARGQKEEGNLAGDYFQLMGPNKEIV
jgi:hypothetical protein